VCSHSVVSQHFIEPERSLPSSQELSSQKVNIRLYEIINLPVILYGCETWPLILREEHRLRVFENWLLRRIFGPKTDEESGRLRKLHKGGRLYSLYSLLSITRMLK
jgi:hypothetical protein